MDKNTALKRKACESAIASNNNNDNDINEVLVAAQQTNNTARTKFSGSDKNTTATATGAWSDLVINDEFAKPSECGTYIDCTACLGRGVNKGKVPSRVNREFSDRKWIEHTANQGHKQSVQNIIAEREREKINPKKKKNQSSMCSYFEAKKKTDETDSTSTVTAGTAATEIVDLSVEDGYKR